MTEDKEKEYRLRIKESEKARILKSLAKDLKGMLQDFMFKNEKLINTYNKGVYKWEQRREIRDLIRKDYGATMADMTFLYYLIQRLSFSGKGRPYTREHDLITDWAQRRVFEDCDKILDVV